MKRVWYFVIQGFVLNALMLLIMYLAVQSFDSLSYGNIKMLIFIYVLLIVIGSLTTFFFTKWIERAYDDQHRFPYEILSFIFPAFIFLLVGFITRVYFSFALFAISMLIVYRLYYYIKNNDVYLNSIKFRIKTHVLIVSSICISMFLLSLALNYI